jgi:AcrR family transcriptional regulator
LWLKPAAGVAEESSMGRPIVKRPMNSAAPLRARMRESTRQAILDAAELVYGEHGFAGGRLERIARQAGVAVGTLYNHFSDRDALVRALLDAKRAELLRRVDAGIGAAGREFAPQLNALVGSIFEHFSEHRRLFALLTQTEPGRRSAGAAALALRKSPFQTALAQRATRVIALGQRQRRIAKEDPRLLAGLVVGMLRATILDQLERPRALPSSVLTEKLVRVFLNGARARP